MNDYRNDPRVEIGLYEAWVASPDGPKYVWAAAGPEDWMAGPASVQGILLDAHIRGDQEATLAIRALYPHFPTFQDAVRSLIGDPQ